MAQIADAGEFIPNAKKHQTRARGSTLREKGATNRLAALWPEPDWVQLERQGRYSAHTLSALAVAYWGLGTSPIDTDCFDVRKDEWPGLYDAAVAIVRQVFTSRAQVGHISRHANYLMLVGRFQQVDAVQKSLKHLQEIELTSRDR